MNEINGIKQRCQRQFDEDWIQPIRNSWQSRLHTAILIGTGFFRRRNNELEPGLCYQNFDLSPNECKDLTLLTGAKVNAMLRSGSLTTPCSKEQTAGDKDSFITICALSKFATNNRGSDGASNGRAKFNSQRGAVLATETE
ncbi:hypothetical protein PPACK8108_LOCUS16525 [Phakopsora pachyrhizi]|uniref:Uncharacterized protein n=1 Tax=Phakopsora pachyrhizi TaxID=170000 RepID=A0AAV0BBW6_PHAPC|nr:hypothetical protein PPACK8108_LOCUS16525 [Phakopsora pachyrhizi]